MILDLHLKCPCVVRWWKTDCRSARFALLMELFDVFDADPNPRPASALVALAQVYCGPITRHAREVFAAPFSFLKTEYFGVEPKADLHVLHTQDRLTAFEANACPIGVCHVDRTPLGILARRERTEVDPDYCRCRRVYKSVCRPADLDSGPRPDASQPHSPRS